MTEPLDIQFLQQVRTVAATATKIPATALRGREFVVIKNLHATATIYIGSVTVTADEGAAGGDPLLPTERMYLEFSSDVDVYGIVASGTAKASVLEGK